MELILNKKKVRVFLTCLRFKKKKSALKLLDRTVYVDIKWSIGQCQFDLTNVIIESPATRCSMQHKGKALS